MGASERDGFVRVVRAAWRSLIARRIDAERLVFVDLLGARTPCWRLCMSGHHVASFRGALLCTTQQPRQEHDAAPGENDE